MSGRYDPAATAVLVDAELEAWEQQKAKLADRPKRRREGARRA